MKKLTPAQIWLVHSLEVLAMGSVFTVVATLYQAFQSGNFNLSQAGVAGAGVLGAFLSKGFSGLLTNAQTVQAGEDTLNEIRGGLSQVVAGHQTLISMIGAFLQQGAPTPVQVHVSAPPAPTARVQFAAPPSAPAMVTPASQPAQPPAQPVVPVQTVPQATIPPVLGLPTISSVLPAVNVQH